MPGLWRYSVIAVSIVSHGHGAMTKGLIRALLACPEIGQVIVTRNIPELLDITHDDRIVWVDNALPKGFGANHNAAFAFVSYTHLDVYKRQIFATSCGIESCWHPALCAEWSV